MKPQLKAKWIEALRSGRHAQTNGVLRDGYGFCCLAVLCDVSHFGIWSGFAYQLDGSFLDGDLGNKTKEFGLTTEQEIELVRLNDGASFPDTDPETGESIHRRIRPHSFAEIAQWIEDNISEDPR